MSRRKPETPRSKIKNALRRLFLQSRERAAALKAQGYCCQSCGAKQNKAKGREIAVEVHHLDGIVWESLISEVYRKLLCGPDRLRVLCKKCHEEEHGNDGREKGKAKQAENNAGR